MSKVHRDRWACDVVDFDSEDADASSLISEGEVDAFFRHRNALRLNVDVNIRVVIETTFTSSDASDELVAFGLPWRRLARNSVELVEKQTERLFTAECVAREKGAISYRKMDFDVQAISWAAINEWRPEPIVYVLICNIAHHIAAPIDALSVVGERLLHPLRRHGWFAFDKEHILGGENGAEEKGENKLHESKASGC
jgi:hypothetical protein